MEPRLDRLLFELRKLVAERYPHLLDDRTLLDGRARAANPTP